MTVFDEIAARGMFLTSLWEIKRGHWRASLRDDAKVWGSNLFGPADGRTAEEAICKAAGIFDDDDLI